MENTASPAEIEAVPSSNRQAWQDPAIVLERSLEARADDPTPGSRRGPRLRGNGLLGPLGTSGNSGNC